MSSPLSGSDGSKGSLSSHQRSPPNLSTLLEYFIAAKRSLTSSTRVYEANQTVAQARASIEDIATVNARNSFLYASIHNQIRLITEVRHALEACRKTKRAEFRDVLSRLDDEEQVINESLERLSQVRVDLGKQSTTTGTDGRSTTATAYGPHTLLIFIDQTAWDSLRALVRGSIDRINAAEGHLIEIEVRLDTSTENVGNALNYRDPNALKLSDAELATAFSELEQQAHDSAVSLESLIKHYDLCVKALRHTEGAGDAIAERIEESDPPLDASGSNEVLPITKLELAELLQVLQNDAREVEAVVAEIDELSDTIQDKADQIKETAESLHDEAATLRSTAESLSVVGNELTDAHDHAQSALNAWTTELSILKSRLPEIRAIDMAFTRTLKAYVALQQRLSNRRKRQAQITQLIADDAEEHRVWTVESKDDLPPALLQTFVHSFTADDELRLPIL